MKNISDKGMIRYFVDLTIYLKSHGINPGLHIIDDEESAAF